jgi:hypothetical protein
MGTLYRSTRFFLVVFALGSFMGCVTVPTTNQKYAQLYIKTIDSESGSAISAQAVSACDGLSLGETLSVLRLEKDNYWTPGKTISVILTAPGYSLTWQTFKLEKWYVTPALAELEKNTVLVTMKREK